jgi:hypothetical protein
LENFSAGSLKQGRIITIIIIIIIMVGAWNIVSARYCCSVQNDVNFIAARMSVSELSAAFRDTTLCVWIGGLDAWTVNFIWPWRGVTLSLMDHQVRTGTTEAWLSSRAWRREDAYGSQGRKFVGSNTWV